MRVTPQFIVMHQAKHLQPTFFSCVPRAEILSHARPGTSAPAPTLPPRSAGSTGTRYRELATRQQTNSSDEAGARRSQHSGDPRHLVYTFLSYQINDIIVPGYSPNFPTKFVSGRPKLSVVAPMMGTRATCEQ